MSRTRAISNTGRNLGLTLGLVCLVSGCGVESPAIGDSVATQTEIAVPRAAQRVQVREVKRGHLVGLTGIAGITQPFRSATVSAEANARVVERHVEPGDRVEAADPLVTVDEEYLAIAVDQARATLAARQVDLDEALRELERGDELSRKGAISDGRHDDLRFAMRRAGSARDLAAAALRRAERARSDAVVRAPFAGTVERIDVQVGDYLASGAPVAVLADFDRVRVRAGVTASEAAHLHQGIIATASVPALGGYETTAAIHSVGRMSDATTGTYPVELWLDNPDAAIRGGMVAQLRFPASEGEEGALAPRTAVLRRQGRLAVYVVEERGDELRAFAHDVRIGRQAGEFVELVEGPAAGARVVVDGLFALTDGAVVFVDETEER